MAWWMQLLYAVAFLLDALVALATAVFEQDGAAPQR